MHQQKLLLPWVIAATFSLNGPVPADVDAAILQMYDMLGVYEV